MQETPPTHEEQPTSSTTAIATVSQPEDNIVEDVVDTTEEEDNYQCTYTNKRSRRASEQIKIMIFNNEDDAKKFLFENDNLLSFSCSPTKTSTPVNTTQSSPKKEGKIKSTVKKLYKKASQIVSSVTNGLNSAIHSQIVKDAKDALVGKVKTGIKKALGSDMAKKFEKQILEHGQDITKKVGNALINKGVGILAGAAIAGK